MRVRSISCGLLAALSAITWTALGQDGEAVAPGSNDKTVRATSMALLQHVIPSSKGTRDMKELTMAVGSVLWGSLFEKDEIAAFVLLGEDGEEDYLVPKPKQVAMYGWTGEAWVFRQDLGELNQISVDRCRHFPCGIVQGSLQVGRHEADQSSWRYDRKSKRLIATGWDFWGKAYVVGDYVCGTRGRERLAHWETYWIHSLHGDQQGELICCLHRDDQGKCTITFKEEQSRKQRHWAFIPDPAAASGSTTKIQVFEVKDIEDLDGELIGELAGDIYDEYCFELLTGLSSKILGGKWMDKLPAMSLKRIPVEVTGSKELARYFQWPKRKPTTSR